MISRVKNTDTTGLSAVTYDNFDESNSYGFEAVVILKPIKQWKHYFKWKCKCKCF